jgi:hypothetical protein
MKTVTLPVEMFEKIAYKTDYLTVKSMIMNGIRLPPAITSRMKQIHDYMISLDDEQGYIARITAGQPRDDDEEMEYLALSSRSTAITKHKKQLENSSLENAYIMTRSKSLSSSSSLSRTMKSPVSSPGIKRSP